MKLNVFSFVMGGGSLGGKVKAKVVIVRSLREQNSAISISLFTASKLRYGKTTASIS